MVDRWLRTTLSRNTQDKKKLEVPAAIERNYDPNIFSVRYAPIDLGISFRFPLLWLFLPSSSSGLHDVHIIKMNFRKNLNKVPIPAISPALPYKNSHHASTDNDTLHKYSAVIASPFPYLVPSSSYLPLLMTLQCCTETRKARETGRYHSLQSLRHFLLPNSFPKTL